MFAHWSAVNASRNRNEIRPADLGQPIESVAAEIAAGDKLTTIELSRQEHTAPSTVFRWINKGLPDGRGGRVFLEAVRRGKTWLTSSAAVRRFLERLEHSAPPLEPAIRTPAKRDRDCDRAEKRLRDRGVNFYADVGGAARASGASAGRARRSTPTWRRSKSSNQGTPR